MNRICLGIVLLIFLSCQNTLEKIENQEIDYIEIYYIPFDVSFPLGMSEMNIKYNLHNRISDQNRIKNIRKKTTMLERTNINFMNTNIHLKANFIHNEKKVYTILSDGYVFKIGHKFYTWDKDLIDLLIQDYYTK